MHSPSCALYPLSLIFQHIFMSYYKRIMKGSVENVKRGLYAKGMLFSNLYVCLSLIVFVTPEHWWLIYAFGSLCFDKNL